MTYPIRQVTAQQTYDLRHSVMWPDKPRDFVAVKGDHQATHFAAFDGDRIIAVMSLFDVEGAVQLRKLATEPSYQGQGIGAAMVRTGIDHVRNNGGRRIILNGRASAHEFYEKLGFSPYGAPYLVENEPCQMMELNLSP